MSKHPPVAGLRRAADPLTVDAVRPCQALFGLGRVDRASAVTSDPFAVGTHTRNTSSGPPTLRRPPPGGAPDQNLAGVGRPWDRAPDPGSYSLAVLAATDPPAAPALTGCSMHGAGGPGPHLRLFTAADRPQSPPDRPANSVEHRRTTLDTGFPSMPSSAQRRMLFATTIR